MLNYLVSRTFLCIVALLACISIPNATLADPVSTALRAGGKIAAKVALRDAAIRASGRRDGALLSLAYSGSFELTPIKGGHLHVEATEIDRKLLADHASHMQGVMLIHEDLLRDHSSLVEELVKVRPDAIEIFDSNGSPSSLKLANRGSSERIVVQASKNITFSPKAWSERALLQQNIMRKLSARMKVIAIVDRTDAVQRRYFETALGDRVTVVDGAERLLAEVRASRNRLVTVIGHVEGENFVLRDAAGKALMRERIESVHRLVDDANSVSLVLGCESACNTIGTGPTAVIDALMAAEAIGSASRAITPLQFLDNLANKVGPLHIDTDFYGRLRVVSEYDERASDRIASRSGFTVRVLVSKSPQVPMELEDWIFRSIYLVMLSLYVLAFLVFGSWMLPFLLGVGPHRVWSVTKDSYVDFLERPRHDVDNLTSWEEILLRFFGPLSVVVGAVGVALVATTNALIATISYLFIPIFAGRGKKLAVPSKDLAFGAEWLGQNATDRTAATALLLGGGISGYLTASSFYVAASDLVKWCAGLAGFLTVFVVLWIWPTLAYGWFRILGWIIRVTQFPLRSIQSAAAKLTRLSA